MTGSPLLIRLCRAAQFLTAAVLGIYAGAMLTEGLVLVPFWRALPAGDFFAWYAANDERLLAFFSPLTTVAALVPLAAALLALLGRAPGRWMSVAASALTVAAVVMFFVYFEAANASFSAASVTPAELPEALARWAAWHHARTLLSLVALAAALSALGRAARTSEENELASPSGGLSPRRSEQVSSGSELPPGRRSGL